MDRFIPQNFNDLLALLVAVCVLPGMWVSQGLKLIDLPDGVIGASIAGWTLVLQFYFRKKPDE